MVLKHVDDIVKEWICEQLKEGEDPEIIKESLMVLNYNPRDVDKIMQDIHKTKKKSNNKKEKKKASKNNKDRKKDIDEELEQKIEEIKKSVRQSLSTTQEFKPVRINIPKEEIPKNESLEKIEHKKPLSNLEVEGKVISHMFKNSFPWVLILLGLCLILIGVYLYFYF